MKSRLPLWFVAVAVICGSLWASWLAMRHIAGTASILDRTESVLIDLRVLISGNRAAPQDIVIVAIDDDTVAAAGRYPLNRTDLAALVEGIRNAGAKALAIDLLLVDKSNEAADARLAEALGSLPTVIAAAGRFSDDKLQASIVPETIDELRPLPLFTGSSSIGMVNIATDAGGTPRHVPLAFRTQQGLTPSLVVRATGLFVGHDPSLAREGIRVNGKVERLDLGWHLPLHYYGPAGTIKTVSAKSLLDESVPDSAANNPQINGRLVLLGVTATAVGDRFSTPFDQVLPGVEVLATGVANLLDGSGLIRDSGVRRIDTAAALAIVFLGMIAVSFCPVAIASVIYLLLLVGWLAIVAISYTKGYWLSGTLPLAASIPPVAALAIARQIFDRHQMRQLVSAREALGRFQAPALALRIAEDPAFLREPVELDVAILFIDLSGYTGLSERLGPAKTRDFLKSFHTLVVDTASKHEGLVLDFMGDGAMIGFGIPDAGPGDAANACLSAFALVRAASDWISGSGLNAEISNVRIGAHCGPAVLSRLGHENQQQIAVTGDCVNVASRLMEVGKAHASAIAASSALIEMARKTSTIIPVPQHMQTVTIRGREQTIAVALWTASEISTYGSISPASP